MHRSVMVALFASLGVISPAIGQEDADPTRPYRVQTWTKVADPKLDGGKVRLRYFLDPAAGPYQVEIQAWSGGAPVATIFQGVEQGSANAISHVWDGRDGGGAFLDPGEVVLHLDVADGAEQWSSELSVQLVRLGITEIEAQSINDDEWQMVYFMKRGNQRFWATPAIHEYINVADSGEVSDLDFDDGSPRSVPAVHDDTAEPVLEPNAAGTGWKYDNDRYNYPLCYAKGATPRFEITLGSSCTSAAGTAVGCNYPVPGFQIRCRASDELGNWTSDDEDLAPGGTATFLGPAMPGHVGREDRTIRWSFEYRADGQAQWFRIPGRVETPHRFYVNQAAPQWAAGASGVQYSGPWVEVAQYFEEWQSGLGIMPSNKPRVVETFMKGYFGQAGNLPTAIEDVHYDCPSEGGDGGATHYYQWGAGATELSNLLNGHANGPFVNCSDVASTTSAMLSMLGLENYEMVRLGTMDLRAIWGIGTPDYTLNLWGGGSHGFSYHHIITRHGGTKVSDSCMWLDEDGDPDRLPGLPGQNHDRPWSEYNDLSASNNVSRSYDPLPAIW